MQLSGGNFLFVLFKKKGFKEGAEWFLFYKDGDRLNRFGNICIFKYIPIDKNLLQYKQFYWSLLKKDDHNLPTSPIL